MRLDRGRLVGRDAELAVLHDAVAPAAAGELAGAVLIGEPGVGKTRLATELARAMHAKGAHVAVSHGVDLAGGELPYAGVAELVRGLVRAVGAAQLSRGAGQDLRPLGAFDRRLGPAAAPERAGVTAALIAAVEGVTNRGVLVWFVDDLQWMDAASRDLLRYLVRVVQGPLVPLVTAREEPSTGACAPALELARVPGMTMVQVRPLDGTAVAAQARSLSDRLLGREELERIHVLSDGLPFYVEQLVAADGRIPSTLRSAVSAPLRELAPPTLRLLRAAALEENLASPDLLGAVAGLDPQEVRQALDEARSRDLLRPTPDGELIRFRHALLRQAVQEELLAEDRRDLHLHWARVLDGAAEAPARTEVVLARGRHWFESGDRAAYPAVLAAARLVDATEDQQAQALWWERVLLTHPGDDGDDEEVSRDRALDRAAYSLTAAGAVDRAADLVAANRRPSDRHDRLRDLWLLLMLRHTVALGATSVAAPDQPDEHEEILAWLATVGPDFRVAVVLHLLLHEWDGSRPDLYLPVCDELIRRSRADGDVENWFLGMRHRGWWLQSLGDFGGQLETARAAREGVLAQLPARRLEAEGDWCWGLEESGRYAEAITAADEALARVTEPRAIALLWTGVAASRVAAQIELGHWQVARDQLTAMRSIVGDEPHGGVWMMVRQLEQTLAARAGDLQGAESALASLEAGVPTPLLILRTALESEVALLADSDPRRYRSLAGLESVGHSVGMPDGICSAVLNLARSAEVGEDAFRRRVDALAERLLPAGGAVASAVRSELAQHALRVAGDDRAAGWDEAAGRWRALGRVYDVAWCRHLQAAAAAREGRRDVAGRALAEAMRVTDDLGAAPLAERVTAVARRWRIPLQGLDPDRVGELTERETEVLRLVAAGRTNAQVADELGMSPKTASVHVSRILTKLGAANRTEAANLARRLGLL